MDDVATYAKEIAKKLKPAMERAEEQKAQRDHFGTISVGLGGEAMILLDGAEEPTPCTSMVSVHHGDRVMAHKVGHSVVVFANVTVPSVNDEGYQNVKDIALEADELLDGVAEAAATADKTVAEMLADADTASALVSGMKTAADTAGTTLAQIVADADSAATTLAGMQDAAEAANTTLEGIYQDAADAQASATAANTAANDALVQLGTVEDVIGTATWIAEHGTYEPTEDVQVDDSKVYYERTGSGTTQDPYIYTAVAEPTDEGLASYYELHVDDALSQYVASHLALAPAGLYVLKDASGYKLLCSNTGVSVIDPQGHPVATYGESITFDSSRSQYIGNQDAYILFTPEHVEGGETVEASIVIGGSNVQLGSSKKLSELISTVDGTLRYDHVYELNQAKTQATFHAHVYRGADDVTDEFDASQFSWWLKRSDETELEPIGDPNTGKTCTVVLADVGYGAHVVGRFSQLADSPLLDEDDDALATSDGDPLSGRTPSGDTVRVSDLEVTTTVFDTDRLMVVGSEDEHLVTIGTLKDVFGTASYEDLEDLPSIEGVTLIDDKSFPDLGVFKTDSQGYDVPDDYTLSTMDINALWANAQPIGG